MVPTVGDDCVYVVVQFYRGDNFVFYSYFRNLHGMFPFGRSTLLSIEGLENLVSYFKISCSQTGAVPLKWEVYCSCLGQ